jgi:hypothetical protein
MRQEDTMLKMYRALAYGVAVGVALQASSIALGFFTIVSEVEGGAAVTADYDYEGNLGLLLHGVGGVIVVPVIALALLIASFFTRAPGAVRWAAGVFGLVTLQVSLAFVAFGAHQVGALHGLNALLLFVVSVWAGRRIGARGREGRDDRALEPTAI